MEPTPVNSINRVVINTIILALRTVLLLVVSLYISRVVLELLGIVDYGIYKVVNSVVGLLTFVSSAVMESSKRYAAFAQGENSLTKQQTVFRASVLLHLLVVVLVVILMESVGLWYINRIAVIPADRLSCANIVFQCVLAVAVIKILQMPFEATMIAHEHMQLYMYASVLEMVLQVVLISILRHSNTDKLILYAILMVGVACALWVLYVIYTAKRYPEVRFRRDGIGGDEQVRWPLLREMITFGGWSIIGHFGFTVKSNGLNLVINYFFGPAVNAAKGVADMVVGGVQTLVGSLQKAISPQVIKRYAQGMTNDAVHVTIVGSKYGAIIMLIAGVPLALRMHYVLHLWLVQVPTYTYEFALLGLIAATLIVISSGFDSLIQATGKIVLFNTALTAINCLSIPLGYLLFNQGCPPYAVGFVTIGLGVLIITLKLLLGHRLTHYSLTMVAFETVVRPLLVAAIGIPALYGIHVLLPNDLAGLLLLCCASVALFVPIVMLLGVNRTERMWIRQHLHRWIN